jgi:hypothetical protein
MLSNLKKVIVSFFKSISENKKLSTYAFFFFIAFLFWFLSMLSKIHETTLQIPIKYNNHPTDLVNITPPISNVDVRVKAPGFSIVFFHFFNFKQLSLSYDLANFKPITSGKNLFWIMSSKRKDVAEVLGTSMEIMNIGPEKLDVAFAYRTKKEVPVILNEKIKLKKEYWLSEKIKIVPATITLYGDQNLLDSTSSITTELLSMNDISENRTIKVNLQIPEGLEIKQKEIEVSINVEQFIEEKINQKISVNNLKSGHVIKLFPNEVTVTLRLPKNKYNLLKTDFLKAEVNLKEIETGVKFLDVHIDNLPSFIKMERLYPQKVEFLLIKE